MTVSDLDAKSQAIILLARGASTDKTGETLGVSGRTIRRWREDPDFEQDVLTARRELLAEARAALAGAARDAITTLHAALQDENPANRIRAASILVNTLPAISEQLELEDRLAQLEAALGDARRSA
ncbi:helix-turn-helix domain-containing protein [Streptomyces sp. NBC_01092]|uniref:helix-turn-helix domain-containing protein n=1 Tax=Streptomyces sp. NBC_01092 TaxID=2903748 RepID=UPI00386B063E|nr:helix-turn-helix domain-containing protein [Streptomyces sp. NBC_01092]WSU51256.1 helix-turn-helix domain-containing protein [Streptomyces sp. NBC_01092]